MATFYVDPSKTGGTDSGGVDDPDPTDSANWTNAWLTLQHAVDGYGARDQPTAGDIVYCRGTETITAQVDMDGNDGHVVDGLLRFVGTNASGVVDGTKYTITTGANECHGLVFHGTQLVNIENFELTTTNSTGTYNGLFATSTGGNSHDNSFINCEFHGWTGNGYDNGAWYLIDAYFLNCSSHDNGGVGFEVQSSTKFVGCSAYDNGGDGFDVNSSRNVFINCLSHSNGGDGWDVTYQQTFMNCVAADNTGDGFDVYYDQRQTLMVNCRSTGNAYGIRAADFVPLINCYFGGNTTNTTGNYDDVNLDGAGNWNEFAGTDTDDGYVDTSTSDYNLDPDNASQFNKAAELQ